MNKNKTKRSVNVKFGMVIGIVLAWIIMWVLWKYMQMQNNIMVFIFAATVLLPIMSVVVTLVSAKIMDSMETIRISVPETVLERGTNTRLHIEFDNPLYMYLGNARFFFHMENLYYPNDDVQVIDLGPIGFREKKDIYFPIVPVHCGMIGIEGLYYEVSDWFGFITVRLNLLEQDAVLTSTQNQTQTALPLSGVAAVQTVILPTRMLNQTPDLSESGGGSNEEVDESAQKGYSSTEILDIREYIPGDRLQAIHWKLSAKAGQLMVKEYESMSAEHFQIIPELSGFNPDILDETLELLYNLCTDLIHEAAMTYSVYYWSQEQNQVVANPIYDEEDLLELFERIYQEKLPSVDTTATQLALQYFRTHGAGRSGYCVYISGGDCQEGEAIFSYGSSGHVTLYEVFS